VEVPECFLLPRLKFETCSAFLNFSPNFDICSTLSFLPVEGSRVFRAI
jgi:hypothetical protein